MTTTAPSEVVADSVEVSPPQEATEVTLPNLISAQITSPGKQTATTTRTLRAQWTYFHLQPLYSSTFNTTSSSTTSITPDLDATTLRLSLLAALSNYLGLHGSAIPVDILHIINPNTSPNDSANQPSHIARSAIDAHTSITSSAFIRVPVEDGDAVAAAIASYVGNASGGAGAGGGGIQGFRVRGRSEWLVGLVGAADGRDLFDFGGS